MIKNERQYRVTKAQAKKFEQALTQLRQSANVRQEDTALLQLQTEALASQLNDLEAELEEYTTLTNRSSSQPISLTLSSLSELPSALIKARIANKLSQKALAEQLGLKEQQIQRYESTDYASASLSRLVEISEALGLKLELRGGLEIRDVRSNTIQVPAN
jgi:ribosome-binding protein aMBF1 (putative translation factor)